MNWITMDEHNLPKAGVQVLIKKEDDEDYYIGRLNEMEDRFLLKYHLYHKSIFFEEVIEWAYIEPPKEKP